MFVMQRLVKSYPLMLPCTMESFLLDHILTVCPNVVTIISHGTTLSLISYEKQQPLDIPECMVLVLVRICWSLH